MNSLLGILYDLLCYVTEDCRANKLLPSNFPPELMAQLNQAANQLGDYLDEQDRLEEEREL